MTVKSKKTKNVRSKEIMRQRTGLHRKGGVKIRDSSTLISQSACQQGFCPFCSFFKSEISNCIYSQSKLKKKKKILLDHSQNRRKSKSHHKQPTILKLGHTIQKFPEKDSINKCRDLFTKWSFHRFF